ncbi:MAG: 50S ribosomal protein L10 [bacterium]|nr:50S ribosomal protein L10 [bacterium]
MPKTKAQKEEIVSKLTQDMGAQKSMVFVDFAGLSVKNMEKLRNELKDLGARLTVSKKTLFARAAVKKGISADFVGLEGQIGTVFAFEDEVLPMKTLYKASKEMEGLKILGGYVEQEARGAEYVEALAKLPGREVLLGQLVGTIANPLAGFVRVLEGNIKGLVVAMNAIVEKRNA